MNRNKYLSILFVALCLFPLGCGRKQDLKQSSTSTEQDMRDPLQLKLNPQKPMEVWTTDPALKDRTKKVTEFKGGARVEFVISGLNLIPSDPRHSAAAINLNDLGEFSEKAGVQFRLADENGAKIDGGGVSFYDFRQLRLDGGILYFRPQFKPGTYKFVAASKSGDLLASCSFKVVQSPNQQNN